MLLILIGVCKEFNIKPNQFINKEQFNNLCLFFDELNDPLDDYEEKIKSLNKESFNSIGDNTQSLTIIDKDNNLFDLYTSKSKTGIQMSKELKNEYFNFIRLVKSNDSQTPKILFYNEITKLYQIINADYSDHKKICKEIESILLTPKNAELYTELDNKIRKGILNRKLPGFPLAVNVKIIDKKNKSLKVTIKHKNLAPILEELLPSILMSSELYGFPKLVSNDSQTPAFFYFDLKHLSMNNKNIEDKYPTIKNWLNAYFNDIQISVLKRLITIPFIEDQETCIGLYIQDMNGNSGKSTFYNAFAEYLSKTSPGCHTAMNMGSMIDKHKYQAFVGKIICFEQDVKNPNLVNTDVYHKITTGDNVLIDPKGKTPYTAKVKVRPFMSGNISLEVDTTASHMHRRLAILTTTPNPSKLYTDKYAKKDVDNNVIKISNNISWKEPTLFVKKFNEEFKYFIASCFQEWDKPLDGMIYNYKVDKLELPIELQENLINNSMTDDDEEINNLIHEYFIVDECGFIIKSDATNTIINNYNFENITNKLRKTISEKIMKIFRINKVKNKFINNKKQRVFEGIRFKTKSEMGVI